MTNNEVMNKLKIAHTTLFEIKKQFNYPKGYKIQDEDIPDIEAALAARINKKVVCSDDTCREIYRDMIKEGSMELSELRERTGIKGADGIRTRFDNLGLFTYDSGSLLIPLRGMYGNWEKDNLVNNGQPTGQVITNQSGGLNVRI